MEFSYKFPSTHCALKLLKDIWRHLLDHRNKEYSVLKYICNWNHHTDSCACFGCAKLSAGSVRGKNAKNIILKNLLDACFGAFGWYFFGYGLAFGNSAGKFGARENFALHEVSTTEYHNWFFQYAVSESGLVGAGNSVFCLLLGDSEVLPACGSSSSVFQI